MDLESQRLKLIASIHELEQRNHPEQQDTIHLGKLKQEYNQVVETIRYQRHGNARFNPLVSFPPEIWIPIIQHAIYRTCGVDMATLGSCVFVSKMWYKYITEAPILWSNIDLNDGDDRGQDTAVLLATFLHLSQACELDISIVIPFASWEMVRDRIAMHRSRIKSIEFYPLLGSLDDISSAPYNRETDEIMRFLSPLSRLNRLEGFLDEPKWLLEEGTPLAYARSSRISLDTLLLPASRTLRQIRTYENIRSIIPLMRNLQLIRDIWFYGNLDHLGADIPVLQPVDIDLEGLMTLNWVSLAYYANHVHFPAWLLTRLPNLVDLRLNLRSVELVPLLSTVHHLTCLNHLSISTFWTQSPHTAPPETMLPCPSLRSLDIYDMSLPDINIAQHLTQLWRSSAKTFTNILDLTLRGFESSTTYISIKSSGFQKLEKLRIYENRHGENAHLLEGEACFPSSLQELYINYSSLLLPQIYSPTIKILHISGGQISDIEQELYIGGWPKLEKLAINTRTISFKHVFHQNLREVQLISISYPANTSCTSFCRNVALYPSNLPSLQSIALDQLPEWDIFFIMLERKNFCSRPGVARVDRVELRDAYPKRFLKPIRDLLSGIYTERPSNLDLSVVGNAGIIFDPLIPGCIECHLALRLCESEWNRSQGLDDLRSSIPLYPNNPQDILLTWSERATWWSYVKSSKFGRKGSCSNILDSEPKWIVSYD